MLEEWAQTMGLAKMNQSTIEKILAYIGMMRHKMDITHLSLRLAISFLATH